MFTMRAMKLARTLCVVLALGLNACADDPRPPQIFSQAFDPATRCVFVLPEGRFGLFRQGEVVSFRTKGDAGIRVLTWRGDVVYEGQPKPIEGLSCGHYFVETTGDRAQFAVLPADFRPASFLGSEGYTGAHNATNDLRLRQLGLPWVRLLSGGNYWSQIQPRPGAWEWEALDRAVEGYHALGKKIVIVAWIKPDWLTRDEDFIPAYTEFVRQLARRYQDKIQAIEVWNEPDANPKMAPNILLPFTRTKPDVPAVYLRVLREARAAIKAEAPGMLVVGAGWSAPGYESVRAPFFELGGQRLFDVYTFHDYEYSYHGLDRDLRIAGKPKPRLARLLAQYRRELGETPIWLDEYGLYGGSALGIGATEKYRLTGLTTSMSWQRAMARSIKYLVMARAAGVEQFIPHLLPKCSTDPGNIWDLYGFEYLDRGPHPKTTALLMAAHWLDGAKLSNQRVIRDQTFLYEWLTREGGTVLISWAREGQRLRWPLSAGLRATDCFGVETRQTEIAEAPVFLRGVDLETFARSLE
jgi:hypothetical protein